MVKKFYEPKEEKLMTGEKPKHIQLGEEKGYISVSRDGSKITYSTQQKTYNFNDPEEKIRARVYIELITEYKYSPHRIDFEVYPSRLEPKLPADLVIFEDDKLEKAYAVVELKANSRDISIAKREGLGNTNLLLAKYLLIVAGKEYHQYNLDKRPPFKKLDKYEISKFPINYGKEPKYKYKRGSLNWDLKKLNFRELSNIFQQCHNILWGGSEDSIAAFDEFSKIMFAKLYDEADTKNNKFYKFQIGTYETESVIGSRVKELYRLAIKKDPSIFNTLITTTDFKIYSVVSKLQIVSLMHTDLDAKGRAFEKFLSTVFRGEQGQFFTRREIVEFMVKMIKPSDKDIILDPTCGSGGFLLYVLNEIKKNLEKDYKGDYDGIKTKTWNFAHYNIFGIEKNPRISRIAKMDMVINGDGHTNIENNSVFNNSFEIPQIKKSFSKPCFTLILANPPFGVPINEGDVDQLGSNKLGNFYFGKNKGRNRKSQLSDILFLERCLGFLEYDGKAGIVLSDGIFTNPSYQYVRDWVDSQAQILAIIGMPEFAFKPAGSSTKTSLLFFQKRSPRELKKLKKDNYKIMIGFAEHIGYDAVERPDINQLPQILRGRHKNVKFVSYNKFKSWSPYAYFAKSSMKFKHKLLIPYATQLIKNQVEPIKFPETKFTFVTISNTGIAKLRETKKGRPDIIKGKDIKYKKIYRAKSGDIVMSRINPSSGSVAIIPKELNECVFSNEFYILRPTGKIDPKYIWIVLRSKYIQDQLKGLLTGGYRSRLPEDELIKIQIPINNRLVRLGQDLYSIDAKIKRIRDKREKVLEEINIKLS